MKKIPLIKPDLPSLDVLQESFAEILSNGRITSSGRYVTQFEQEVSAYLGVSTLSTSSGTAGLILALQSFGLKKGQKVILPSFTFTATAQAVLYAGGIPVFAEVGQDLTLDPSDLHHLLQVHSNVGAVIPVHTFGLPCHIKEIQEIVDDASQRASHPIAVIYDAAHAFGSKLQDGKVGNFGNAEVFSLSVTKVLVSVEGGLISTKSADIIQMLTQMRNYGIRENYNAHLPGLNGRMSEFHALIGLYNLHRIDDLLYEREKKARYYIEQINRHTEFRTLPWPDRTTHTFKDFTVMVPQDLMECREKIRDILQVNGVETRAYFNPPLHQQIFFERFSDRLMPFTDQVCKQVINLPFFTSITEAEIDIVVSMLSETDKIMRSK